jgi:hypothetical protein
MQPYFDQTRKTTLKKNGRRAQKKWKTTSKKMEDHLKKNGKLPQKKMEDHLSFFLKN